MNENRMRVLQMLADKRISAAEAEQLMTALDTEGVTAQRTAEVDVRPKAPPTHLRVLVEGNEAEKGPTTINVRVPIELLRAGMKLTSLLPPGTQDQVNEALQHNGAPLLAQITPQNLDAVMAQLHGFSVEMESSQAKVRVFCE